jgi:hypothetical protein
MAIADGWIAQRILVNLTLEPFVARNELQAIRAERHAASWLELCLPGLRLADQDMVSVDRDPMEASVWGIKMLWSRARSIARP